MVFCVGPINLLVFLPVFLLLFLLLSSSMLRKLYGGGGGGKLGRFNLITTLKEITKALPAISSLASTLPLCKC
jgi:hypothetical protein